MQLHAQRHSHFEYCGETWVAVFAERFVKAFAAETCVASDLRHAFGTRDVAQRASDSGCVIRRVYEPRVELGCHFFRRTQLLGHVIGHRFGVGFGFAVRRC